MEAQRERRREGCATVVERAVERAVERTLGEREGSRKEAAMVEGWATVGCCTLRRVPGGNRLSFSFG